MAVWLTSRNELERRLPTDTPLWSHSRHFVSGALASVCCDMCTFPFDTLKKNMQAGISCRSAWQEAVGLLGEGGVARFYRGYSARFCLVALNGALFNWVFVVIKENIAMAYPR